MRKQNHARYNLPSMENAKVNMLYAFTYNPGDQPASFASDRIGKWWVEQARLFGSLKGCTVTLNVEISKLSRLHFHGTLTITSLWKFYYYDVIRFMNSGAFEIDTISKMDEWQAYIDKNKDEMSEMMKAFGLPRTLATKKVKQISGLTKEGKRFFKVEPDDSESEDEEEYGIRCSIAAEKILHTDD